MSSSHSPECRTYLSHLHECRTPVRQPSDRPTAICQTASGQSHD
jgi:hypothetical protein